MNKAICLACALSAWVAAADSVAQVQISSSTQGTAETTGQVGVISPLTVIYSDRQQESTAAASSPGLGGLNQSLPQLQASAGTTTPTVMNAEAAARGSTLGSSSASTAPNSFDVTVGTETYGDIQTGIFKTQQDLNPGNLFAEASAQSSLAADLIFTVAVPSFYSLSGQAFFQPYASGALAASDIKGYATSSLALYQLTAQGPGNELFTDSLGETADRAIDAQSGAGVLAAGTYELSVDASIAQSAYVTYESGGNKTLYASLDAGETANLDVAPVPLPATLWQLVGGMIIIGKVTKGNRRGRRVEIGAAGESR